MDCYENTPNIENLLKSGQFDIDVIKKVSMGWVQLAADEENKQLTNIERKVNVILGLMKMYSSTIFSAKEKELIRKIIDFMLLLLAGEIK